MNSAEITLQAALDILGLAPGADADAIQAAFRRAAKTAHPDAGGTDVAFATVRAAFDRLRAEATRKAPARPSRPARPGLAITPLQALTGGQAQVVLKDGQAFDLMLEPGLREGDRVEIGGASLRVTIREKADIAIKGDDVWLSIPAPPHGGRVSADTPLGERTLWIGPGDFARGILRFPGQGLPAKGRYRAGDLVIQLTVEGQESPLSRRRKGFLAAWAA